MQFRIACVLNIFLCIFGQIDRDKRINCYPDPFSGRADDCTSRGCMWDDGPWDQDMNEPTCYYPPNTGYYAEDPLTGNTITLKKSPTSMKNPFGQDFDELTWQLDEIGNGLRVQIFPKSEKRYVPLIPINTSPQISSSEKLVATKTNSTIFSFTVQRQSNGMKIWDTSIGGLLFADKFIQIAAYLGTDKIYGFGEHIHTSIKHDMTRYTTWGLFTNGGLGEILFKTNLYGVHPFYLGLEDDGKAHGVFIFNSNAADIDVNPAPHLVYRTIGGQLEIFFFPGPTPEQVIQQYQQVIGTPFLPAYWALGFHFCRHGFDSTKAMEFVVGRMQNYSIPLDVVWGDIDSMDHFKDFTIDPTNWYDWSNYSTSLHAQGLHVIINFSPVIEVDYDVFQRGLQQNASFIEWPRYDMVPSLENNYPMCNGTKILLGCMWPDNNVAWPDFLDPTGQTNQWWANEFALFQKTIAFDGMWIDMNEPAVFGTGFYKGNSADKKVLKNQRYYNNKSPSNCLQCPISGPDSEYDTPPYLTISGYQSGHLASSSLCMCATTARNTQKFYDTKNLHGWSEMRATANAITSVMKKRGFVLSRSTFAGSGVYGAHWTGDNHATWDDLKYSIIAVQEFNMFGIPAVGADICGFHPTSTEELCLRWQQLGAFYPFMRNMNLKGAPDHDPGVWPSVAVATRIANLFRYRHLPYLYSLYFSASLYGGTVARPVMFEFPNDPVTWELSFQFMWGHALMIVPVTDEGASSVNGYLPPSAVWYSVYDYFYGTQMNSSYNTFTAPTTYLIPVFVRGGYILPRQKPAVTTTLARQNEMQLLVALDSNNTATGELYWDDGETVVANISTYNNYYFLFNFHAQTQNSILNITMAKQATGVTLQTLDNIEIFGYPYNPNLKTAKLNGNPITINTQTSNYSPFTKVLNITTTNFLNLNSGGPTWLLTWDNQ